MDNQNAGVQKLSDVVKAPNIAFGDQHPDDPAAIASSFDARSDSLLRYHVSITYTTCATLQTLEDGTCAESTSYYMDW